MATSVKVLNEEIRNRYYSKISEFLSNEGEEILQVASNRFAFPIVDSEGNEKFVEITVKVPTGSKDEIYDGYSLNEEFTLKETERKEKAKVQGLTPMQVSVMASIVSGETLKSFEYPIIAGVYLNRYRIGLKFHSFSVAVQIHTRYDRILKRLQSLAAHD